MIGNLNQRADILARTLTPDGAGGNSESWNAVAIVWCSLAVISGDDAYAFDAEQSRVQYRATLRRTNVTASNRLAIGERTFRIAAVEDGGGPSQTITLTCEELP